MTDSSLYDVVKNGFQCLTIPRSGRYRFEVVGASWASHKPGARIIGVVWLEKGEKVTVALGQHGKGGRWGSDLCGNGGTFVVKESGTSNPQPLFVAGGAGSAIDDCDFAKASLTKTASGNDEIGSSGVQTFFTNDEKDFFCGGAGFLKGPVTQVLRKNLVAPKCYKDGLVGGTNKQRRRGLVTKLTEAGFGGGGAWYHRNGHRYWGAGGGYTGGGTKIDGSWCIGGGGGSFSIDEEAQFDHVCAKYGECTVTYLD